VALVDQLGDAVGLHGYAVLVVLDLLGDSYDQGGHANSFAVVVLR
jgi:hypothetical protein